MGGQITREDNVYSEKAPLDYLMEKAKNVRMLTLQELYHSQSGHPGSSLSAADLVVDLLFDEMNWKQESNFLNKDRFILSKGHAVPVYYAALAEGNLIPKEELMTLRKMDSRLQGHPWRTALPEYVSTTTGSLAQGLSVGLGMAKYFRQHKKDNRVYVLMGDGELQEGQIWEATMAGGNYGYNNIVGIVDRNGMQNDGPVESTMPLEPLDKKFEAFGWNTLKIDGHDFSQIRDAFKKTREVVERPTMIIAKTDKGRLGPNKIFMHGVHAPKSISETDYVDAINYLKGLK